MEASEQKRGSKVVWWVVGGVAVVLVLIGGVAVLKGPSWVGNEGFCSENTSIRLTLVGRLADADGEEERAQALQDLVDETAPDLSDRASSMRWPGSDTEQAEEVADAWAAVGDADSPEQASELARDYFAADEQFQEDNCGGAPTSEDFEGL